MMNLNTLQLAERVAATYDDKGLCIVPIPNTPLAAIAGCVVIPEQVKELDTNTALQQVLEESDYLRLPGDDISAYGNKMDEVAMVIAEKLKEHLVFVRTVVNPYIQDFVTRVKEDMVNMTPSALLNVDVSVHELPSLLSRGLFKDFIERSAAEQVDMGPFPSNVTFPEMGYGELLELIQTGNQEFNTDLVEYLGQLPNGFLEEIYTDVFLRRFKEAMPKYFNRTENSADRTIVAALLGHALFAKPIEGVVGTLAQYNVVTSGISAQACYHLKGVMEQMERNVKRKTLIVSIVNGRTVVNGPVYRDWLENGGDVDLLLGNSLLADPYRTVEAIEANRAELVRKWKIHTKLVSDSESLQQFNYIRRSMLTHFKALVKAEVEGGTLNNQQMTDMVNRFVRELDFVTTRDIKDLNHLAIRLISRSRFVGLDADVTLGNLHRIVEENDTIDVREAALLATINYCVQWVAMQMKVVRC